MKKCIYTPAIDLTAAFEACGIGRNDNLKRAKMRASYVVCGVPPGQVKRMNGYVNYWAVAVDAASTHGGLVMPCFEPADRGRGFDWRTSTRSDGHRTEREQNELTKYDSIPSKANCKRRSI